MNKIFDSYRSYRIEKSWKLFKKDWKLSLSISGLIKALIVGAGLAAFFVGALLFQANVIGVGTPQKAADGSLIPLQTLTGSLVIAGITLSLLFGTVTLVLFGTINVINKRFGERYASIAIVLLILMAVVAIVGIGVGTAAYTRG